ncbi:sensor histidine kinase N-terminal domain-containing protein [Variovorax sp. J22P240]|uniref:sensor histidine kinase n=1 Tax=unclassified Variovorax TaxID=663243 RepID=UPI002578F0C5|nr:MULTISPECIES: sensor histidine kinase [unclassified Variovorax]MDM0000282.1 sensor histidine kinase N-terminal domain-containing protein [Variovorax sp. J22P240]MDM0050201.1 sensor histidine kinase N-terminal domain-containing protein [Variovorax sp. J22R115]
MWRSEPRLQRKLLAWLLGPLTVLLVLDTAAAYWNSLRFANLAYDRALHEIGREIALHVKLDGTRPRLELSEAAANILFVDPEDQLFYRVIGENGADLGGDPQLPAARVGKAGKPDFYGDAVRGEPVRMMVAWMPVGPDAGPPQVLVQVAETLNKRARLTWEMVANVVLPQLLLIVMATAVVWFGVSRGLEPLQRLRRAVSDRSHLDLSPIDIQDVPGEVRPLVDDINELMGRLGRTFDFQNRFVADAAHQLKTPVSGLKAQIELALRESDLHRVRHSLAQLYISADRLSRLVRQLLSLARNEPGALDSMQLQPLDLNAHALEVSMDWAPQAIKRNIDLGFEGAEHPLMIDADQDRLRELVNNLIDNAIRYSQSGGRVTVQAARINDDQCRLAISDDGPRIPVEERARIFERFHRLLGTQEDGSGLGLAIVSEIATLHGARITLEEDIDGVGNTFSVFFPLRAA